MRALVLGATGHIGAHIIRALLSEGHHVRAAYRNDRALNELETLPVERVRVDLDTLEGLSEALQGCEWVFHAAGYYPRTRTRRDHAIATGLTSTRRILESIRRAEPRRVVFTSSAATIQRLPERSLYATVKIAMEHEALHAAHQGLPLVIANPSICIGEYDAHRFSGRLVLLFAKYRLPFYLDQEINVVYTGDVGVAHVRAAERGQTGERYLLSGRTLTLKAFGTLVAGLAATPAPRWRLPAGMAYGLAWMSELLAWGTGAEPLLPRHAIQVTRGFQRLDGTKAIQELSMPQTPIEEAIQRALAWFRRHGDLP